MKNKIVYSFILVFLVSLLSSARIAKGTCDKATTCSKVSEKRSELKKEAKDEFDLSPFGLFFFNI